MPMHSFRALHSLLLGPPAHSLIPAHSLPPRHFTWSGALLVLSSSLPEHPVDSSRPITAAATAAPFVIGSVITTPRESDVRRATRPATRLPPCLCRAGLNGYRRRRFRRCPASGRS